MDKNAPASDSTSSIELVDLSQISYTNVKDYYYRVVSYRHSKGMLSTVGAQRTGGRFNFKPPDDLSFPTLYCSDNDITAKTEKFYGLLLKGKPLPPHTVASVEVNLSKVVDLSTLELCQQYNIDWDLLNDEWEDFQDLHQTAAYSQQIGKLLYELGAEGILFESTKHRNNKNLAVFKDNLLDSDEAITIYDPDGDLDS